MQTEGLAQNNHRYTVMLRRRLSLLCAVCFISWDVIVLIEICFPSISGFFYKNKYLNFSQTKTYRQLPVLRIGSIYNFGYCCHQLMPRYFVM